MLTNVKVISVLIILAAAVMAVIGWHEAKEYEKSVLAIYAQQQDAYVQLVLDQINVLDERSDEEIVQKILGSLDTSGRKYWTLTKDQALLFVKDVTETNRYKGLTTETFFTSDSAARFLQDLEINRVIHETIRMDGVRYVASGVIFEYNGAEYKICLLTNDTVILDNNIFLSSKIGLYVFGVLLLGLLLVVSMIFANVFNISLVSSSCDIFMLFNTTSDAFEISSATSAPNVTIVSRLLTSIVLTIRSTSSELTSSEFIFSLSATMSYCSTTAISSFVSGTTVAAGAAAVVVLLKSSPIRFLHF